VNVLVVEDELRIADFLAKGLMRQGFDVHRADTGSDALARIADGNRHAPIDLVVLDLGLPDIDGLDVLRALRARRSAVPVIVLTARSEPNDRDEALRLGAVEYLTKPLPLPEFLASVRANLNAD